MTIFFILGDISAGCKVVKVELYLAYGAKGSYI